MINDDTQYYRYIIQFHKITSLWQSTACNLVFIYCDIVRTLKNLQQKSSIDKILLNTGSLDDIDSAVIGIGTYMQDSIKLVVIYTSSCSFIVPRISTK